MLREVKKLVLNNYRTFKGRHEFDFSKLPVGFYYVYGDNVVEPRLEGNDAGKSNFIGAACWALFGKTQDEIIAKNVCNWATGKECLVELHTDNTILSRGWNPNFLKLDGDVKEQEEVEEFYDNTFNTFIHSNLIGQFTQKFFDLDPAPRLRIFSAALSLSVWEEYSEKAKKLKELGQDQLIVLENDLSTLQGRIKELKVIDYTDQIEMWERDNKKQIKGLEKGVSEVESSLEDVELEIDARKMKLVSAKQKEKKAKKRLGELRNKIAEQDSMVGEAQIHMAKNLGVISSLENKLYKFESLDIGRCSMCGNVITEEHIKTEIEGISKEVSHLQGIGEVLQEAFNVVSKSLKELKKDKDLIWEVWNKEQRVCSGLEKDIQILKDKFFRLEKEGQQKEYEINVLEKKENPYEKMQIEQIDKMNELHISKCKLEDEIEICNEGIIKHRFWSSPKGFKSVRFMIINECLGELELSMNNSISNLGLRDWYVKPMVDRETDSNTIKKGFEIFVRSPYNKKLVPFKTWGGGVKTRLKTAATMGISDFLCDKMSGFDVEFWDEPTSYLSNNGIDDLFDILTDRAVETKKRIFVIEHGDFPSFEFAGKIKIQKTEEGSSIVVAA